jgi:hypothetical protein
MIGSTDAPGLGGRPRCAVARTRKGDGSSGSSRTRSTGYASSKDSPPGDSGELIVGGGGRGERRRAGPPGGGIPHPITKGRRSGRGAAVRGGRRGARGWEVSGGGARRRGTSERHGGASERCGGGGGCHGGASRTLKEEEAGVLQFEIRSYLPKCPCFRGAGAQPCVSSFAGWHRPSLLLHLLRCSGRTRPCRRGGARRERHGRRGARRRWVSHRAERLWPRGRSRKRWLRRGHRGGNCGGDGSTGTCPPPRAAVRPW